MPDVVTAVPDPVLFAAATVPVLGLMGLVELAARQVLTWVRQASD
jgi:hypothetical protein